MTYDELCAELFKLGVSLQGWTEVDGKPKAVLGEPTGKLTAELAELIRAHRDRLLLSAMTIGKVPPGGVSLNQIHPPTPKKDGS